ncbi:MAG: conjugal transfer pilus assembly protein TraU [Burkholderiales bacterium]
MKSSSTMSNFLAGWLWLAMALFAQLGQADTCVGKFPNPITDICWECMFPMTIGSANVISMDQEDTPNPGNPVCTCGNPPNVGTPVSFWEPMRRVDVARQPFCMVSLGGVDLSTGFNAPVHGHETRAGQGQSAFYQVHWYIDPMLFYLQAILDDKCLDNEGFDVGYLTELDPMWNDDEMTRMLNPDIYLFLNIPAQAACAADCVTATAGFPSNTLYWCAGCQGSLYPLDGNIQSYVGGAQGSMLEAERMVGKMIRQGTMAAASGEQGMCGYYPQIIMDKSDYKFQMLYPIPQTTQISGKCCQPLGRSTVLWGSGKEFPFQGEDFVYEIFRKRNCCQGAF